MKDLDAMLDEVSVTFIGMLDEEYRPAGMEDWYMVEDGSATRGIFPSETDALFFRLALINATLNPVVSDDGLK